MSYKGKFRPRNTSKYKGDPRNIVYRSGLELMLMNFLDKHPDVLEWSSEELTIPYRSPIDGKIHRYFPDFFVKRKNRAGEIESILIEVKPSSQCKPPVKKSRVTRRFLREVQTWGVNSAKWKAATQYCKQRDWKFQILTEKEINSL